jgi:hypothetical protein
VSAASSYGNNVTAVPAIVGTRQAIQRRGRWVYCTTTISSKGEQQLIYILNSNEASHRKQAAFCTKPGFVHVE